MAWPKPAAHHTTRPPPPSTSASPRARHVHSPEHVCASVGFLGLEGSCRRPRDRRGASRSQRQPAATLDARCEHPRQRGQLNPTQEPSAAARGRVAGACRTWSNRGTFRRDRTSGDSRRRHGGASAPCSSATPWRRGSPPTWRGAVEGKRAQPDGGRQAQSAEHARARAGLRGLRGGRRPPCDRREAPRRQRQPPDPAADTCEHGGRCQPNPLLEPPAAARGRAREGVRCAKFAGLLGGILPQGVLVEGFGGRRHHLQVPKRGTLRFPLWGGWGLSLIHI